MKFSSKAHHTSGKLPLAVYCLVLSLLYLASPGVAHASLGGASRPAAPIADEEGQSWIGNYCVTNGGASLLNADTNTFALDVPGAPVAAVWLWSARTSNSQDTGDRTITVNGVEITADSDSREASHHQYAYVDENLSLVSKGINSYTVSSFRGDSAGEQGVVLQVIYEDAANCPQNEVKLQTALHPLDAVGSEAHHSQSRLACEHFTAADESRQLAISLFATGATKIFPRILAKTGTGMLPAGESISSDGATVLNPHTSNLGQGLDVFREGLVIPPGAEWVCLQIQTQINVQIFGLTTELKGVLAPSATAEIAVPESYGVAEHTSVPGVMLGLAADERDGALFARGGLGVQGGSDSVTVTAVNQADAATFVDGWIDFDGNGQFNSYEKIIYGQIVPQQVKVQTFTLAFDIPETAACGPTFARFRLGPVAGGPTGSQSAGEAEEYPYTIACNFVLEAPTAACPAAYELVTTLTGAVRRDQSQQEKSHTFTLAAAADLLFQGYAVEGQPESGCSPSGGAPGDNAACRQHEANESFDVFFGAETAATKIGDYRDSGGDNEVENAWFKAGPWTASAAAGEQTLTVRHALLGSGAQSVGYEIAVCAPRPAVDEGGLPQNSPKMETAFVPNVSSSWVTATLHNSYDSPVAVCSSTTAEGDLPHVVRMRNAAADSFQLRLQNPSGAVVEGRDVHCLVMEEGVWQLPDGRQVEAHKYGNLLTDSAPSWQGEAQSYGQSYNNPVILGQVMSYNDARWSVFWSRGVDVASPPSAAALFTGLHIGEDADTERAAETVGYIVLEAGAGRVNGVNYEFGVGEDLVQSVADSPPYTYALSQPFDAEPSTAVVTQVAMDGGDGSWAYLFEPLQQDAIYLALDEDQLGDEERGHTAEQVGYAVFGGPLLLTHDVVDLALKVVGPNHAVNPFLANDDVAVAWEITAENLGTTAAANVAVEIVLPDGIEYRGWKSQGEGWHCIYTLVRRTISCTTLTLEAAAAAPTILINTAVPPNAELAGTEKILNAAVSASQTDGNALNDNAAASVAVRNVWRITPGNGRLYTHVRFSDALDGLPDVDQGDYLSNEYIINHIQVPLALGFGFDASAAQNPPMLCLTYRGGGCPVESRVTGIMRVKSYTVSDLVRLSDGAQLLPSAVTVGMDYRLASLHATTCLNSSRCIAFDSYLAEKFQWAEDEYIEFNFVTKGGRPTRCTAARCIKVQKAAPGLYEVRGIVTVEAYFPASAHPDLTQDISREYKLAFVATLQIVAPFVQPQGGN